MKKSARKNLLTPIRRLLLILMIIPALTRCSAQQGGNEAGNPALVGFKVVGLTDAAAAKQTQPTTRATNAFVTAGLDMSSARIVLEKLRFRTLAECAAEGATKISGNAKNGADDPVGSGGSDDTTDDSGIKFVGPFVIDLLTNQNFPSLSSVQIAADTYCRIELELDKLEATEVPTGVDPADPIVGRSIYIAGTRVSDSTPVTISFDLDEEFRIENTTTGFVIADTGVEDFLLAFRLADWFTGVDLSAASASGGTIVIDNNNNRDLLDAIKLNLKRSSRLFSDSNRNGSLDDDEKSDDRILARGDE